ncbi:hypothetical protein LMJF_01_0680 [Leishmania major strain Friedlin]|uniref:Uncharacterized protein n=1 Tax=Leishmania major TaxID=5664 RepID=E9AC59_LEIMA|nr:hypothetical protein LMJF_01_0680 [Leishmania major strain Friedlin]CAG9567133.1 hypothetical_protein_-_conserved [Leishmania major strain Friedlin]CBZ11873.1 hypothetical protein LMJF_01_0680 [Leishmania major strain Friedlin]|eukprot:XP_003721590.1 hypothetical protein LMJF_01_0680 [Leishmania major strain Friedlin]
MGSSAMSASPFSAVNGFRGSDDDDDDDGRTALSQVRQALADRRRMRSGVIAGVVDPVAAASASPPLLAKPRKGTSHEPSLCVDRSDNENSADCQRRQAPGSHKQHRERRSPSAPDAFLSCVEDGKLLSVSPLPSPLARAMSASPLISKSSAPVLGALPPSPSPRRISYYGGFLAHTLDAHDLAGAVFPKSSYTDALPLPMSAPQTDNESSVVATDQSSARSRRERPAASGRSNAVFDKTLAEAMVSTVVRMRENEKRRGSAAQPQQPLRRDSLSTNTTIGSTVFASSHRPGLPTTPITSRAMAAFGHTTADVLNVADYNDSVGFHRATARGSPQHHNPNAGDTDVYAGDFRSAPMAALTHPASSSATASQHCLCTSGTPESSSAPLRITASRDKERASAARSPDARSRQSSTLPAAPSVLWDITGQPVHRDGVRGLSTTASGRSGSTMMTVSSGTADVAVPEVAAKAAAPQLSYHQLTEAFYGSYKGGEMAQDAYLYFVAQQQQQQQQLLLLQQPEGSSGGTTSRHGNKHQRSRPSAAMTTTPTRTAARARGGCTVQRVFVSGRSEIQPTMTSQASTTSLTAAAATRAAPAQLEPRSISTDTPLSALRRSSNAAAAAAAAEWQHPHSQPEARPSSTSLVSVHSSNDGSCHSSASRGNGHGASSPSSPLRLSVTVRAVTAGTTAARGAVREAVDDVEVQQQQPRKTSTSKKRSTAVAVAHAAPSQRRSSGRSSFSMDAEPRDTEVDQMSEPPSAVASSSATAATDTATTTDRIRNLLHKSVSIYQEAQQQQSEPHEGPPDA